LIAYIIEKEGVNVLPVDAAEHRAKQEWKNNASIPYDRTEVVDRISNGYQN